MPSRRTSSANFQEIRPVQSGKYATLELSVYVSRKRRMAMYGVTLPPYLLEWSRLSRKASTNFSMDVKSSYCCIIGYIQGNPVKSIDT